MSSRDHSDHFLILRAAFRERGQEQGIEAAPAAVADTPDDVFDSDGLTDMGMHFQDFLKMTDMKMEVLQEQYKERLMFRMDDEKNEELDGAIRRLTTDIKSAFRMAEEQLKAQQVESSKSHAIALANARKTMAQKLQMELTKFRKMQSKYKERLEVNAQPPALPVGEDGNEAEETSAAAQLMMVDQILEESNANDALVEERAAEIQKIVQDMQEINMMFKDLAVLVEEQGEIVDRIDVHMETVNERTKSGVEQLKSAAGHQKKCAVM